MGLFNIFSTHTDNLGSCQLQNMLKNVAGPSIVYFFHSQTIGHESLVGPNFRAIGVRNYIASH